MAARALTVALLVASLGAPTAGGRKLNKRRMTSGKRGGNTNLGKTAENTEPLHRVDCGGRVCRPGEGNLKGYEHWSMPWTPPPIDVSGPDGGPLLKMPLGWGRGEPFPAARYEHWVAAARRVQQDNLVVFAAADFDFRELGENWYRAARRAGVGNALLYALDSEAANYFASRSIAAANGTDNLNTWATTRLQRHLQRALAERHMAAAALVHAGLDVLMSDTTHIFMRPVLPFLRSQPANVDVFAMRGMCNAKKEAVLGCGLLWNFLLLRGATDDARRARVLRFVHAAIDVGMVDFYLRWWAGHHCIFMGYVKLVNSARPVLDEPSGAAANAAQPNRTAIFRLTKRDLCKPEGAQCLTVGMLPSDAFPVPGRFVPGSNAIVGRSPRPDLDPKRSHRLRLDRYDETDFANLQSQMAKDGLWLL